MDVAREYGQVIVVGPTALMATLASDPAGQDLFEYWHYEDVGSGRPAAVEDLFDATSSFASIMNIILSSPALHFLG